MPVARRYGGGSYRGYRSYSSYRPYRSYGGYYRPYAVSPDTPSPDQQHG